MAAPVSAPRARRRQRVRIAGATAIIAAAALMAACGGARARASATPTAAPYRGAVVTPPIAKPEFTLTDTSGAAFDFRRRTDGHVTLLYFGYTNCPDICPTHMANIATALKTLPPGVARQVDVVFVTTDPARDTPSVLRTWLDHFDRRFVGLTGTPAAIAAAERAAGEPPATPEAAVNGQYGVSHAAYVIAFTQDGMGHLLYPGGVQATDWEHDLPRLVASGWTG